MKSAALAIALAIAATAVRAADADGIAWFPGDVDAAFAQARKEHKPLFLYWGAAWCPPCNQVKATIFKRHDFIERTAQFVPVYVDGDEPQAQALADRFHVSGYPTMVLFTPDGSEITRLPGEIDPEQYLQALALGLGSGRPAHATLRTALGNAAHTLGAEDWTLLADYSWDTDEGQLVAPGRVASTLLALAQACPARFRAASDRLVLRAIIAAIATREKTGLDRERALAHAGAVLADPARARAALDLLVAWAPEIAGSLTEPHTGARRDLAAQWDARLAAFTNDTGLSTADRLDAQAARVALAHLDDPNAPLPGALVEAVRTQVAAADRETTDRFERQAVISAAAQLLSLASLDAESDQLLGAELQRSAAPYYLMLELAANARKRGDAAAAIDWYRKAYAGAQGPATRLQWGARYVSALTELAPSQDAQIGQAAAEFFGQLDPSAATFDGRNRRTLERLSSSLLAWNADRQHDPALQATRERLDPVCQRLPAGVRERSTCEALLKPAAAPAG